MVTRIRLLLTLDARRLCHSGLDPESPRTFRNDPTLRHIEGILNQVQDDGGATACAASLRSDRFGSDATNNKQLSLASRVSHSGLDPESRRTPRDVPTFQHIEGILNRVQDDGRQDTSNTRRSGSPIPTTGDGYRSGTFAHGFVGIGGTRPTLRETIQNHSLFTIHYSLKTSAGGF